MTPAVNWSIDWGTVGGQVAPAICRSCRHFLRLACNDACKSSQASLFRPVGSIASCLSPVTEDMVVHETA